jgi:hypothetical protein
VAGVGADVHGAPPRRDRQAATIQLLVPAERRPQLDAAVQRLSREHGDRFAIRYVGPLAPYSFADLELEEA